MTHKLSEIPVIKVAGTGNDFLVVDLRDERARRIWAKEWDSAKRGELAKRWCDRHSGLGADGLVILEPDEKTDFVWDFYNSDGGPAEMCGNAARAVSLYVSRTSGKKNLKFRTRAGEVEATVKSSGDIEVAVPEVAAAEWSQTFTFKDAKIPYHFVNSGVPHAVLEVPNLDSRASLRELALGVKGLARFTKAGVNVTFLHALSKNRIESVTFERGVEDFTLACGTGAIAAAYAVSRGEEKAAIEVQVPGGLLSVVWKNGRPHLRGPATIIAEMRVIKEA